MNQIFYMMTPRSAREGDINNDQPDLHCSYAVMTKGLRTQKTILGFHPTAKTRADP